jgi:hypothetical protein
MRVLSEMNFLIDDHDEFVKSLAPKAASHTSKHTAING